MIRAALWFAAGAAVTLSLSMNAYFWFATLAPVGWQAQWLMVAVSFVAGTFKTIIPAAVAGRRPRDVAGLWLLFVVALSFDLASGLGFSRMLRDGAGHDQREINRQIAAADAAVKSATVARDRLTAPRVSVARLRADLEAAEITERSAKANAGKDCDGRRAHTTTCREATDAARAVAETRGAIADAEAFAVADAKVASALETRRTLGEQRAADPQAEALARVFGSLGFGGDAGSASLIIGGLMLLLLELGSTVAVAAAHTYRAPPTSRPAPAPQPPLGAPASMASSAGGGFAVSARIAPGPTPGRVDMARTLASIRDGSLEVPGCTVAGPDELHLAQQPLADAIGSSKPTVSRALKSLAASGAVQLSTGRNGTVVKFLNPHASS